MRLSTLIARAENAVVRNAPKVQARAQSTTRKAREHLGRKLVRLGLAVQPKLPSSDIPY